LGKGEPAKTGHIFEEGARAPANDNNRRQAIIAEQKAMDHALAEKGRILAEMQAQAWAVMEEAHRESKEAIARAHQKDISAAKASAREEFRPAWRELYREQASERETYEELEESFFGRASNMAKTIKLSNEDLGGDKTGIIRRTFGILTNAGKRKEYFEAAQKRAEQALEREQSAQVSEATKLLEATQATKFAEQRAHFEQEREALVAVQSVERAQLQDEWRERNVERQAAFQAEAEKSAQREAVKEAHRKAAAPEPEQEPQAQAGDSKSPAPPKDGGDPFIREFLERSRAKEQDNDQSQDHGRDHDDDIDI